MKQGNHYRAKAPAFLAAACVGFVASVPAFAEEVDEDQAADGRQIVVEGQVQHAELDSPRATAPLLDTPQTVTIVSDQVIRKQNLLTLRDVLTTIPGITFGAGEGGGGYGDSINLRGYSANNDITVDGIRDSAQYSRTDPFNLQQVEVYNGANSVFNGSGSIGGTINLVSKAPQAEDLTILQGAVGTDNYFRGTIDSNHRVSDLVALRLNAMYHRNDVPGRDVESYERWGIAPSLTLGVGGPTQLTLAYVHQEDDNTPIYGVPYFKSLVNDGPFEEVDRSDYFGYRNLDEQNAKIDRLTATFVHDFSDSVTLRNLTRAQRVAQYSQTSAPQGTFCLSTTGRQPVGANGGSTQGLACPASTPVGMYLPSGPRGLVRDQENQLLANQTDLRIVTGEPGATRNTLVVGMALSTESYGITSASLLRNPDGSAIAPLPLIALTNPDTVWTGPINFTVTAKSTSKTDNIAFYAFDTLELGIVELNAGVRWENNSATFRNVPLTAYPPGTTPLTPAQLARQTSDEDLFSYRVGAVVKPLETVSLHAAYGNSKTPSSATVRQGCGTITTSAAGVYDPCATAPEGAVNYEIGAKADLLDRKLQVSAALFRNERTNFRVPSNDPLLPTSLQELDGRARVDGIALSVSGNITPEWTVFANYTYLDSEVRQSVSDFCLAMPGFTPTPIPAPPNRPAASVCGNSVENPADPQAGQRLLQTPQHSGSLFTTYRFPFGLELGYGLTYQGRFALNNRVLYGTTLNLAEARFHGGTLGQQFYSDDYLTHRLFVSYTVTDNLTAQLNVQNVTDELYYTGIRNNVNASTGAITGGWATPGEARSATLSLFYSF